MRVAKFCCVLLISYISILRGNEGMHHNPRFIGRVHFALIEGRPLSLTAVKFQFHQFNSLFGASLRIEMGQHLET